MFLDEVDAKAVIAGAGITVPAGVVVDRPDHAADVAARLGPVMVKAQVPAGKRGKGGGIVAADTPDDAAEAAARLIGSELGEHRVDRVLVEERASIERELYVAVTIDPASAGPLLIVSGEGGMDIEEVHATRPDRVAMVPVDILDGLDAATALGAAGAAGLDAEATGSLAGLILTLYGAFRSRDAQLLEINPLALVDGGDLVALDCKLVIDDNAVFRQDGLPEQPPVGTDLERRAAEQDFLLVELDGNVGVLANGAGLTMSTMDAVTAHGGNPANFLEVGGMAYKRATPALRLVLSNPNVNSLLVNLCGAYARTDVIVEGLIEGWKTLKPDVPVSFCIHGTGAERARQLVRDELGIEPHELMDDAVRAAITAGERGQ